MRPSGDGDRGVLQRHGHDDGHASERDLNLGYGALFARTRLAADQHKQPS